MGRKETEEEKVDRLKAEAEAAAARAAAKARRAEAKAVAKAAKAEAMRKRKDPWGGVYDDVHGHGGEYSTMVVTHDGSVLDKSQLTPNS